MSDTDYDDMLPGEARRDATQDEPEWYERLDQAVDEVRDATRMLLGWGRCVKAGQSISMAPRRAEARQMLESAMENIRKAMEEV